VTGPLEVVVVEFPGEQVRGEIMSALASAIDAGTLRILDLTFIRKDAAGVVTSYELAELEECDLAVFDVVDEVRGLLSVADIAHVGAELRLDSSAALMVLEHSWTGHIESAILDAHGRIVVHERIHARK
jgi:Family of unknown function (DUF6325)